MKTEHEIRMKLFNLRKLLDDALEENVGDWDSDELQNRIDELEWVLK